MNFFLIFAQLALSYIQSRQQVKAQQSAAKAQLDRQSQEQLAAFEQNEAQREAALKRNLASRRARLSGQGILGDEGSSASIFQGLRNEINQQNTNEFNSINRNIVQNQQNLRLNLLDQSQKQQRDLFSRTTTALKSFGDINVLNENEPNHTVFNPNAQPKQTSPFNNPFDEA